MKPETVIALSKESDHAKNVLAEDINTGWAKYKYLGAVSTSIMGISFLTKAILYIAKDINIYIGGLTLFISLAMIFSPWYFIIRQEMYRRLQLLSEALLTINDSPNKAG